ncbi:MAG: cytochrome c oxidase subunit 4 [Actinobacteria bacterium]|nr:cytochrome c oxidase subunit 4 [Actinomycetota bacterium]
MRHEAYLYLTMLAFFGLVAVIYWFTSIEDSGTIMLAASALLGFLPGSYFLWWSRRMRPRPEDRKDASIPDGAGVIDSFPGSSIWPFVLGMGLALVVLALIFGIWTAVPGGALIASAIIGVTVESRRGGTV